MVYISGTKFVDNGDERVAGAGALVRLLLPLLANTAYVPPGFGSLWQPKCLNSSNKLAHRFGHEVHSLGTLRSSQLASLTRRISRFPRRRSVRLPGRPCRL
eukprot:1329785-Amorphochlora_amoeboformis.AAC.1